MKEILDELSRCAWCAVKLKWWRRLILHCFCADCNRPRYPNGDRKHRFNSRVGYKER